MNIQLQDLTFTYPRSPYGVFDINLEIKEGELLAIIGSSGSGKTTLLKLIAGFELPQKGTLVMGKQAVQNLPPSKRNLGVVFQSYALFPLMTAAENVAYPLKVRGVPKGDRIRKAKEMLQRVGLEAFADRLPQTLSGGQQQRIALARALVFHPNALLLDEPLSALDAKLRIEMRDEIRSLQRQNGITTIHVTHDQEEALSIADRVAFLKDGKLVQVDTPKNLYDHPKTIEVARFVGRSNLVKSRILDSYSLETPFGKLPCNTQGFTIGQSCIALIRPEAISVYARSPSPSENPKEFSCSVLRDRFLGPVRRVDLSVQGYVLEAETMWRKDISCCSIDSSSITLFKEENLS
ncbi:MAG: ABC transporter ATP-binding protein [Spirochaetales bacterium]